jgi:hypothetical protein
VGRKLDRIHNYEANLPEEDNRQDPSRRSPGRSMFDVSCRCDGRFDLGQWVRFAQKIL